MGVGAELVSDSSTGEPFWSPCKWLTVFHMQSLLFFVFFPETNIPPYPFCYFQESFSRNLPTFVSPYTNAVVINSHTEMMIVILSVNKNFQKLEKKVARNLQEASTMLNRPITVAAGWFNTTCSYVTREVRVRLRWRFWLRRRLRLRFPAEA